MDICFYGQRNQNLLIQKDQEITIDIIHRQGQDLVRLGRQEEQEHFIQDYARLMKIWIADHIQMKLKLLQSIQKKIKKYF